MSTSASFANGVFAFLSEEFDNREKQELTERLQRVLEALDYNQFGSKYESEISLLSSLLYYGLNWQKSISGGCMRTPGQDYCGLSLVSPVSNPVSSKKTSNYATIELSEYIVLHVVISLVNYLMCPRYQSVLSRVLLPLLPCFLTNSSDCMFKMSTGGILTLFGEVHRMLLLVDGRFVTPVHRFLQIRMTTGDPESAGQKRTPDSKMVILFWLIAFRLSIQGVPMVCKCLSWLCYGNNRDKCTTETRLGQGMHDNDARHSQQGNTVSQSRQVLSRKCTLCMDYINADCPASPSCGHVFCYPCITHWLTLQPRCPICRFPQQPQQVRMLYNI